MLIVKKKGTILEKTSLGFESLGVLNPAVIKEGSTVYMFYRAIGKDNISSIGYCEIENDIEIINRKEIPILYSQFAYEKCGVEDPRIVKIDDIYYLTYTAYDGINALSALAISKDLKHWEKKGVIVPKYSYKRFKHLTEFHGELNEKYLRFNREYKVSKKHKKEVFVWDKNVILFPRKINGKFYFLHRIKPDIQIISIKNIQDLSIDFWEDIFLHFNDYILLTPKFNHEISYIGGGCPPIETEEGWLLIYHGVHDTIEGYVYSACACLLELENPMHEIARLPYPLFEPDKMYEKNGIVHNVCFPTGALVQDDDLYIYYGAADEHIACATVSLSTLLTELLLNPI